jgi:hypothetical protein
MNCSIQGRQTDIGIRKPEDLVFPETFLVDVSADAVEPELEEDSDG